MIERLELRRDGRRLLTYGATPGPISSLRSARVEGAATVFDADLGPRVRGGARAARPAGASRFPAITTRSTRWRPSPRRSEAGIADDAIREALAGFSGVKRRFQLTGTWNGVPIYDDYGHHPVEIAAVLKAARAGARGRVIAVVEPHRYTRVRDLFDEFAACFKDADSVIVAPLYSAGELPIDGIDHAALAEAIRANGHSASPQSTASARSRRRCSASRRRATWSSASAPATAPNGRTRCRDWLAGEPRRAGGAA